MPNFCSSSALIHQLILRAPKLDDFELKDILQQPGLQADAALHGI